MVQIQRMVISGGNFKPDSLKPKEVVSLLLDDEEIEQKCKCFTYTANESKLKSKYIGAICRSPKEWGKEETDIGGESTFGSWERSQTKGALNGKSKRVDFFFTFHSPIGSLIAFIIVFRLTNKLKNRDWINHTENRRSRISVRKVVQPNHCLKHPKTMNRVVKMWWSIVTAYPIRAHKHF